MSKKFTVTGKLSVQQMIPGDGDTEVPLGAQVLVQFSRSVAPLTTLANQPKDTVVTFDPLVVASTRSRSDTRISPLRSGSGARSAT